MVGRKGLEPSHLSALEPKSSVSTNSTTGPIYNLLLCRLIEKTIENIKKKNLKNGANDGIRTHDIGHHKAAL